ncbi:MAG: glutathione S-transferase N-terminal domain-containing protein [Bauldia litoralis]
MLKLFDFRNSVCCQKARIALSAKGLAWEEIEVDLFKSEQYDPEYLKLNPRGVVPTLVHDGRPVPESTLICEYLDEAFPEPPLTPPIPGRAPRCVTGASWSTRGCTRASPRSASPPCSASG